MVPMAASKVPGSVNDFHVLPLRIPPLPSFPRDAIHYLYIRAHAPKLPTENTPREVFLVNVPVDATEAHIRSLFADHLGGVRIEHVDFEGARVGKGISAPVAPVKQSKKRKRGIDGSDDLETADEVGKLPETWDRDLHRSGGTAIVTFVDRASADMALKEVRKASKSKEGITWGAGMRGKVPALGSARYLAHHRLRYPSRAELQGSVDDYMAAFTAQEEARQKMLARQRAEPDEDGFITVTRGGRMGPAREEEARAKGEELRKRDKERIRDDFYRFQTREKKKEQARDLVKSFEEDKRKVEEMKRKRGKIRPE